MLHGTYPGDAGNIIRRALAQKQAREVGYFHCHGADFFLGYLKEGYLFSPDHPVAEELAQAEAFGRQVAGHIAEEAYSKPRADPVLGLMYRLERSLINRWLVQQMYSRMFTVNKKKCTACGLCRKQCPTGNITEDKDGRPVWGRNCLLCLQCEMKCPQSAITSLAIALFRPAMLYNVYQASRNPALDYVRVEHKQGRTRRV